MMWFSICIFAVSVLIGSLNVLAGLFKPWELHRGQKYLVIKEALFANKAGLKLLWHACVLVFVITATLALGQTQGWAPIMGEMAAAVVLLLLLANNYFTQQQALRLVDVLRQKWGAKLGFIVGALQIVQKFAQKLFPDKPVYTSEPDLRAFMKYEQKRHGVLAEGRHKQLSCLMEVQDAPITPMVIPLADAELLKAVDLVGPLLLAQLHESQYGVFAVRGKTKKDIIGVFSLEAAVRQLEREVSVDKMMSEKVVFVSEDATILQAIQEFTEMNTSLLVVLDQQNKAVGIVYLQDVLRFLFAPTK